MSAQRPVHPVPGAPSSAELARVPSAHIQRSVFDLGFRHSFTMDAGFIYPVADFDVLPGDTFDLSVAGVVQMQALVEQLMDALHIDLHWWFVPNRLVMTDWPLLMGERPNPDSSIDVLVPRINPTSSGFQRGTYADYMGYPMEISAANMYVWPTSLALRSLVLTYNTWYRDQNLIDSIPMNLGTGDDFMSDFPMMRRGKRKDPFTGALPFAQKGAPVLIPMGTTAPIVSTGLLTTPVNMFESGLTHRSLVSNDPAVGIGGASFNPSAGGGLTNLPLTYDFGVAGTNVPGLQADISAATAVTINALRLAVAMQQVLELFARGGTRYTEVIQSLFGVTNPDARLQRPEFLGGSSVPMQIHSVVNQAGSSGSLGVRAAFGHAQFASEARALHSFTEHGTCFLVMSIRQEYTYWQGLDKRHTKRSLPEFYMPPLAMLGEQDIRVSELLMDGVPADDSAIFGYMPRWEEYRWQKSRVTNLMRPDAPGSLAVFNLAQVIGVGLTLSQDFIEENPPVNRIIVDGDQPAFRVDLAINNRAARALPVASVPGLRSL